MPETVDPVVSLEAKELPVRAAAARDLAVLGTVEHLDLLVRRAIDDPSPGVRLGCAAAAADILSRHRTSPAADRVTAEHRAALLLAVGKADPSHNVGLFQVCGALGTEAATHRILIGLRDPRSDVRAGALVGCLRLAQSATAADDLEARLVPLLDNEKIRPETQADLASVFATLGYWSAINGARRLAESPAKGIATAAAEAVARLSRPPGPDGLWIDLGVDAGEVRPGARIAAMIATVGDKVYTVSPGDTPKVTASARPARTRHLLLRRPGSKEAAVEVLQLGRRTAWAQDADEQVDFGDLLVRANAWEVIRALDPILPATASTFRLRGAAALREGRADEALVALAAATGMKRCPVDAWYFHGAALVVNGQPDSAKESFEGYLTKASKKAQFISAAREALALLA
ncbi:MAG: hypothetical protein EXR69_04245 [Myxococcales bacterium]|nr:hypothetical protein [Myxococcales bacterium]